MLVLVRNVVSYFEAKIYFIIRLNESVLSAVRVLSQLLEERLAVAYMFEYSDYMTLVQDTVL